jgi:hypothetical protein
MSTAGTLQGYIVDIRLAHMNLTVLWLTSPTIGAGCRQTATVLEEDPTPDLASNSYLVTIKDVQGRHRNQISRRDMRR